jgi:hypothetical protein
MDALPRLLLRFIIVPVGYFAGVLAGTLVILFGSWKIGRIDSFDVEARAIAIYGYAFAAPVLLVILLSVMWLPTAIGILLSEVLALRSWMFHAGNGALSAWIAWSLFGSMDDSRLPLNQPLAVIGPLPAGMPGSGNRCSGRPTDRCCRDRPHLRPKSAKKSRYAQGR